MQRTDRCLVEAVRVELSAASLNLTDKQLQMWFWHRTLSHREAKEDDNRSAPRKEKAPAAQPAVEEPPALPLCPPQPPPEAAAAYVGPRKFPPPEAGASGLIAPNDLNFEGVQRMDDLTQEEQGRARNEMKCKMEQKESEAHEKKAKEELHEQKKKDEEQFRKEQVKELRKDQKSHWKQERANREEGKEKEETMFHHFHRPRQHPHPVLRLVVVVTITTILQCSALLSLASQYPLGSSWKNNGTALAVVPGEFDGVYRVFTGARVAFTLGFIATLPPQFNRFTLSVVALQNFTSQNGRFVAGTASVVWSANRGHLVAEGAVLRLEPDGNLVLVDGDGRQAWASQTARRGVRALEVLPSGNLVLLDDKNGTVWQSFDQPSEVLLPGQKLYVGSSLVSSVSTSDRSPGTYSLVVELDGVYLYASSAVGGPQPYYGPGIGGRRGVLRFFSSINGSREQQQYTRNGSDCFSLISISVEYDRERNSSLTLRESWNLSRCNISAAVFNTSKPLSLDTFGSPFGECTALLIGCYLRLDPDGDIRQYQPRVPRTGMVWSPVGGDLLKTYVNSTSCFLPNQCGPYGVCGDGGCRCPGASASTTTPPQAAFFQYIDPAMPQLGCTRSTPLNTCGSNVSSNSSNARTVLLEVDDVGFFAVGSNRFLVPRDRNVSLEVCKQGCLRNCTCQVLLFTDREVETLCYYAPGLSYGLRNKSVSGAPATGNGTGVVRAFFKVLELPQVTDPGTVVMPSTAKHSVTKLAGVISSGVFVLLVLIFVLALYLFHKRRLKVYKLSKEEMLLTALSGLPPKVSYKELKAATGNFGRRLGSGEQGDVYEAVVLDGSKVAVKQLELGPLVQNDFHDQVATLARIQHYNLVRLRGYCAEGAHLHLVYELVPNGSLDTWLFWSPPLEAVVAAAAVETNEANGEEAASTTTEQQQQQRQQQQQQQAKGRPLLPWNVRFNISLGIARGLLHLHEGCSEQVLHLALKPQSILLDANMNPKISGYGLSKLKKTDERQQQPPSSRRVQRESRARGYQAPEWLLHAPASPEMDVYSFGMILLEIISGRRNLDVAYGSEQAFFPSWACEQVELGRQMLLVDGRLADAVDPEQAEKLIHIALWCIQEVPKLRPRMRFVVEMLEGQERVPKAPSSLHVVLHNTGGLFKELGAGFSMEKLDLANFDQNSDAYDRELELSDVELLMSRDRSDTCAR